MYMDLRSPHQSDLLRQRRQPPTPRALLTPARKARRHARISFEVGKMAKTPLKPTSHRSHLVQYSTYVSLHVTSGRARGHDERPPPPPARALQHDRMTMMKTAMTDRLIIISMTAAVTVILCPLQKEFCCFAIAFCFYNSCGY